MNCLLPLLFLVVPDLRNPKEAIIIPADDSYKKSVVQVESEWKGHVKRLWTGGDGHVFCKKNYKNNFCAVKVFVIGEDEIRVQCTEVTLVEGEK